MAQVAPVAAKVDVEPQSSFGQPKPHSYNILVTGVTGYGKSDLITGLSGETANTAVPTPSSLEGVHTKEITPISCVLGENVNATFWDTPGLLGGEGLQRDAVTDPKELLTQIAEKCACRDMVVHCMRCTDCRQVSGNDNSGMLSIGILTKQFGVGFWTSAIFALTFANSLEDYRLAWRNLTDSEKQEKFRQEMDQWESFIRSNLTKYAGVPRDIVKTVSVVPVGHYMNPFLLNGQNWIEVLKNECITKLFQSASSTRIDTGSRMIVRRSSSSFRLLCVTKQD